MNYPSPINYPQAMYIRGRTESQGVETGFIQNIQTCNVHSATCKFHSQLQNSLPTLLKMLFGTVPRLDIDFQK